LIHSKSDNTGKYLRRSRSVSEFPIENEYNSAQIVRKTGKVEKNEESLVPTIVSKNPSGNFIPKENRVPDLEFKSKERRKSSRKSSPLPSPRDIFVTAQEIFGHHPGLNAGLHLGQTKNSRNLREAGSWKSKNDEIESASVVSEIVQDNSEKKSPKTRELRTETPEKRTEKKREDEEPKRDRLRHSRSLSHLSVNDNNSEGSLMNFFATEAKFPVEKNGPERNRLAFSYEISRDDKVPPRPLYGPTSEEAKPITNKCKS